MGKTLIEKSKKELMTNIKYSDTRVQFTGDVASRARFACRAD